MKNIDVIMKWKEGNEALSYNGNLSTDGTRLYSYQLVIGYRSGSGTTILADYTSPGGSFKSMTTSQHIGIAREHANHLMNAVIFENTPWVKPYRSTLS